METPLGGCLPCRGHHGAGERPGNSGVEVHHHCQEVAAAFLRSLRNKGEGVPQGRGIPRESATDHCGVLALTSHSHSGREAGHLCYHKGDTEGLTRARSVMEPESTQRNSTTLSTEPAPSSCSALSQKELKNGKGPATRGWPGVGAW